MIAWRCGIGFGLDLQKHSQLLKEWFRWYGTNLHGVVKCMPSIPSLPSFYIGPIQTKIWLSKSLQIGLGMWYHLDFIFYVNLLQLIQQLFLSYTLRMKSFIRAFCLFSHFKLAKFLKFYRIVVESHPNVTYSI